MHRILLTTLAVLLFGCDSTPEVVNPFENAQANPGDWTWIPVSTSICRDGSTTGFGFRYSENATSAVIHLDGGGACYDEASCALNRTKYSGADFTVKMQQVGEAGLFDTTRPENPYANAHHVFFPYCTGDLGVSSSENVVVPGVAGSQQMVGFDNIGHFAQTLAPFLSERSIDSVLLSGSSAGAIAAPYNYPQIRSALNGPSVSLMVDALPMFNDTELIPMCFQEHIRSLMQPVFPTGCPNCAVPENGGFSTIYSYLSATYPNEHFAMIVSTEDFVARTFLGPGRPASCDTVPLIPGQEHSAGLQKLRDEVLIPAGNWSTYFWPGSDHTILLNTNNMYNLSVAGSTPIQWLAGINNTTPAHIGLP